MLQGPRPPSEKEYSQVVEFLTRGLRKDLGWSIDTEYPTALNPLNLHNMRIIMEDAQILSHAVIKPLIVKTPRAIFKVGAIGSVYTEQNARGRGLSTQILNDCIKSAREQLCDFAILWTNLYDYYQKFGFLLAGSEVSIVFNSKFGPPIQGLKYIHGKNVSADAILRLYSQHTVATIRNLDEVKRFLNIPETQVYTAWDSSGNMAAFAIEGKGADLKGYIHEWGGSVSHLLSLFSYIREMRSADLTVIAPLHSYNLIKASSQFTPIINQGYLGMIKPLNLGNLAGKLKRAFLSEGISDFVCDVQGEQVLMGCGKDVVLFKSDFDFTRILFGPYDFSNSLYINSSTKDKLARVLPLPLWLWGWDSI